MKIVDAKSKIKTDASSSTAIVYSSIHDNVSQPIDINNSGLRITPVVDSQNNILSPSKTDTSVSAKPLSSDEFQELQTCETTIAREWNSFVLVSQELSKVREDHLHREWDSFVKVGNALATIRDSHLYRQNYSSFEQYCREKWHYGKTHAYRLISAAETVRSLSPMGDTSLCNERQLRPLYGLSEDKKRLVWQKAKSLAADKQITSKHVKAAMEELISQQREPRVHAKPKLSSLAESVDDWQKAHELIKRTLYLVKQGGNHPENTESMLKLLEDHILKMETAYPKQSSK